MEEFSSHGDLSNSEKSLGDLKKVPKEEKYAFKSPSFMKVSMELTKEELRYY
jgi:hypothetical protein